MDTNGWKAVQNKGINKFLLSIRYFNYFFLILRIYVHFHLIPFWGCFFATMFHPWCFRNSFTEVHFFLYLRFNMMKVFTTDYHIGSTSVFSTLFFLPYIFFPISYYFNLLLSYIYLYYNASSYFCKACFLVCYNTSKIVNYF